LRLLGGGEGSKLASVNHNTDTNRPCLGRVAIPSRKRRPDPFRQGLIVGFLAAAVPAVLGFLLCLAFTY
jgi:hypothetical protein